MNTTEAVRVPMAVGVNVTLIVQLAFTATEGAQLSFSTKSLALEPVTWTLEKLQAADPPFVTEAVPPVDEPTATLPKLTVLGFGTKFAIVTETVELPPPPPHDIDHRAKAKQDAARVIAMLRSRRSGFTTILPSPLGRCPLRPWFGTEPHLIPCHRPDKGST